MLFSVFMHVHMYTKPVKPAGVCALVTLTVVLFVSLIFFFSGDKLRVSDPEGTFDATRLSTVTDVLLLAAGTG